MKGTTLRNAVYAALVSVATTYAETRIPPRLATFLPTLSGILKEDSEASLEERLEREYRYVNSWFETPVKTDTPVKKKDPQFKTGKKQLTPPYRVKEIDEDYNTVIEDSLGNIVRVGYPQLTTLLPQHGVDQKSAKALLEEFTEHHYEGVLRRRYKAAKQSQIWHQVLKATEHFPYERRQFYRVIALVESSGGIHTEKTGGCVGIFQNHPAAFKDMKRKYKTLRQKNHSDIAGRKNVALQVQVFDYFIRSVEEVLGTTLEDNPDLISAAYNAGPRVFKEWRDNTLESLYCAEHLHKTAPRTYTKKYAPVKSVIVEHYILGRQIFDQLLKEEEQKLYLATPQEF